MVSLGQSINRQVLTKIMTILRHLLLMFLSGIDYRYMVSNTEAQKKLTEVTQKLETIHEDLRHTLTVFNKERGQYNTCHNRRLLCTNTSKSTVISQKPILFTHNLPHQDYISCGSYHPKVIVMGKCLNHSMHNKFA